MKSKKKDIKWSQALANTKTKLGQIFGSFLPVQERKNSGGSKRKAETWSSMNSEKIFRIMVARLG
jgi:hypothetical protein